MLLGGWVLRIFIIAAFFFPRDLLGAVRWSLLLLDACFDRLRLLLLRILSYAPGKAPVVEDMPSQFRPDRPLAYPAASPLEFAPAVLGWNEGNDLCGR